MSAHSSLGPSAAERWINCPASVQMSAKVPKPPTSPAAAEGIVAHSLAEEYVTGKTDYLGMMTRVGEVVREGGHEVEITEEMVDGAVLYHDTIKQTREEMEAKGAGKLPLVCKAESRVGCPSIDNRVWGTADYFLYRKGDELVVFDYKFGKGVVKEATENEQLALYVRGVMETEAGYAFSRVRAVIVQPRAPHSEGPVRTWTLPAGWMEAFLPVVRRAAVETLAPNPAIKAGPWCRWCPAAAVCPELHKGVQAEAAADFSLPAPMPASVKEATSIEARNFARVAERLPEIRLMPTEKLVRVLEWEDTINSFLETVREVLRERLSNGPVPGVKLVEGRSNRVWRSEDEVKAEFGAILGAKLYVDPKIKSPAQLEKVVGKGKVDHLTFKPEGKKHVALDTDSRPAVASSAQDDFKSIVGPAASDADLLAELNGGTVEAPPMEKQLWP